jgi:endonuclease YncB( thermonuclease family)
MRRRRLFRSAPAPRRWGRTAVVGATAGAGALVIALGLPSELMGSAPRHQEWRAAAAELRVVDGDTLRLGDRTLRLYGVDAPERGQHCTDLQGRLYDCGTAAAAALAGLVADRGVECRLQGRDRFGRALGVCRSGEVELNRALVSAGWALADGAGRPGLAAAEAEARQAQRGLWTGGFEPPAHWRDGR